MHACSTHVQGSERGALAAKLNRGSAAGGMGETHQSGSKTNDLARREEPRLIAALRSHAHKHRQVCARRSQHRLLNQIITNLTVV